MKESVISLPVSQIPGIKMKKVTKQIMVIFSGSTECKSVNKQMITLQI